MIVTVATLERTPMLSFSVMVSLKLIVKLLVASVMALASSMTAPQGDGVLGIAGQGHGRHAGTGQQARQGDRPQRRRHALMLVNGKAAWSDQ
jgi:hypothetical protein